MTTTPPPLRTLRLTPIDFNNPARYSERNTTEIRDQWRIYEHTELDLQPRSRLVDTFRGPRDPLQRSTALRFHRVWNRCEGRRLEKSHERRHHKSKKKKTKPRLVHTNAGIWILNGLCAMHCECAPAGVGGGEESAAGKCVGASSTLPSPSPPSACINVKARDKRGTPLLNRNQDCSLNSSTLAMTFGDPSCHNFTGLEC